MSPSLFTPFDLSLAGAAALDSADELAPFRDRFVVAEPELLYMDGNSLGRLPKATRGLLLDLIERQWGERLIRAWNEGWFTKAEQIGNRLARLIGARPGEVIIADSTTVNLYKLTLAALRLQHDRRQIITDDMNFPSDLYVFQNTGAEVRVVPSRDGVHGPVDDLARAMNHRTALVSLSHAVFKSGYVYDMAAINRQAHGVGALVLWDLSHSVGSVPVDLSADGADLAVGCTYKYLNGGPGAPAFLYVRRELQERLLNPVSGWFGQRDQFALNLTYEPAAGIRRFLSGTPPLLSLAAIEPGIELVLEAGMDRLREKACQQTAYLIALWEVQLAPLGFTLNSPREPERRGSHVSLGHPDAARIDRALIDEMQVLPDFRRPDNIRFGIAPIYTRYQDIYRAVDRVRRLVVEGRHLRYPREMPAVT